MAARTEGEFSRSRYRHCLLPGINGILLSYSNPLGCAVAMTALDVLVEENLAQRAFELGEKFRSAVRAIKSPLVKTVRGRGLLNAVVIDEEKSTRGRTAWQLCLLLKSRGVLAKPTHVNMYVSLLVLHVCLVDRPIYQHSLRAASGYLRRGPSEGCSHSRGVPGGS